MMRILLVHRDPEPELTRTLAYEGHDVLAVGDDERPARFPAVFNPDLVLVVARDGAETCRDLRRHTPDVPIVAIVASRDVEERIAALEAGADDCLGRPFHRDELIARLGAARRRSALTAANSRPADEHTVEGAA
jgi:two-component system KDP operon response regulator KdpE